MTNNVTLLEKEAIQSSEEKVYETQAYNVILERKGLVDLVINFERWNETKLTREEIIEEALGYLETVDLSAVNEEWVDEIIDHNENGYYVIIGANDQVNINVSVYPDGKSDWTREEIIKDALTSLQEIDLKEVNEDCIERIESNIY